MTVSHLFPYDWYWIADDGRLFSSSRQALIAAEDPAYESWVAGGNRATIWPRTDDGSQTDESLQAVIGPYDLFVEIKAYARHVSWQKRSAGAPIEGLLVPTDPDSLTLINGMASLAQLQPERVFNFDTAAGPVQMNAGQAVAFAAAVGSFVQSTFDRRAEVLAAIDSGEIATKEAVDAAFSDL